MRQSRRRIRRAVEALAPSRLLANAVVGLNVRTHRTWALPILLYAPTSRCNSRCISCEYWRSDGANDLRRDEVVALCRDVRALHTKLVVFTGGEPLVRDDVFELADLFRAEGVSLHLLTSGLALERHAEAVSRRFDAVTISLDGHTPELYRQVRGVDGLEAVERGVRRLQKLQPGLRITARSTLHRGNFRALSELVEKAASMGLQQISFLTADVTSPAFGRAGTERGQRDESAEANGGTSLPVAPRVNDLLLHPAEVDEFERVIEKAMLRHARAFDDGFVAERGDRLRRLGQYYRAHSEGGEFPRVECNAPWASAVVESDGTLRPCFFQPAVGNIREKGLRALLDDEMVRFRQGLDIPRDGTCQRCVCSLRMGLRSRLW
jgi:MoaA/NifB/PqqE/SkfB family radical SAM enzyme